MTPPVPCLYRVPWAYRARYAGTKTRRGVCSCTSIDTCTSRTRGGPLPLPPPPPLPLLRPLPSPPLRTAATAAAAPASACAESERRSCRSASAHAMPCGMSGSCSGAALPVPPVPLVPSTMRARAHTSTPGAADAAWHSASGIDRRRVRGVPSLEGVFAAPAPRTDAAAELPAAAAAAATAAAVFISPKAKSLGNW
eukprot:20953-Chlamydomonas_euryale.AAC.1